MNQVRLSVSALSVQETIDAMQVHVESMDGNTNFPTPEPAAAEFTAGLTRLQNAVTAYDTAKQGLQNLMEERDAALAAAKALLSHRISYVELKSAGDPVKVTSAGFSVRGSPSPISMTQVHNLELSPSEKDGELIATWDPVHGARVYQVQICTDTTTPPSNWVDKATSTRSECILNDTLQSGQRVYARVRAVGAHDEGAWSDLAAKTVP